MHKQLLQIAEIVSNLVGNEYLYFDEPIKIKQTPHTAPCNIFGVCVSPDNVVFVMDSMEEWTDLNADKKSDSVIISSLYQRMTIVEKQYKVKAV